MVCRAVVFATVLPTGVYAYLRKFGTAKTGGGLVLVYPQCGMCCLRTGMCTIPHDVVT